MRIAFISLMSGAQWGGSEELWCKAADKAIQQGHTVFISIYNWGILHPKIKKLKENGAIIHKRTRFENQGSIFNKTYLHFKNRIHWLNNSYNPIIQFNPEHLLINQGETFDIVIHHSEFYNIITKSKIKYSLICHSHPQFGDIPPENVYPNAIDIFRKAENVFVVSKRMQNMIERKLCNRLTNAKLTWNPLNLKNFNYISWPEKKKIQFAIVGYLGAGKGHDTLFECLSNEKWQERDWHLNIFGRGSGEKYLKDLASFLHLQDRISFHGHVSEIENIWQICHLLLIPSSGEGLPITLVEAMVCGRPSVVTDVGGNTEVITENMTGFIAESPTVSSFSKALQKAWDNKDKWKEMGMNAHQFCTKHVDFNPEITLLNTITINR